LCHEHGVHSRGGEVREENHEFSLFILVTFRSDIKHTHKQQSVNTHTILHHTYNL